MIDILYQDENFTAINKPPGLLMHPSSIARDVDENLQNILREQLGQKVYLVHRLDRKTSGVVLVALNSKTANLLALQFFEKTIQKTYWAIGRGHLLEDKLVTKALENENGNLQSAETSFIPLKTTEIELISGKYDKTRLSLIECSPKTGRTHQIRRHLGHLRHYIINDKPHGDCKVNKAFKEQLNYDHMMLHAKEIAFDHPISNERISIEAPFFEQFTSLLKSFEP